MILNFRDAETAKVYATGKSRKFGATARVAARRLAVIGFAKTLADLREPPGNRLEALQGGRKGRYSIRINDQCRGCFRWDGKDGADVELVDDH